MYTRKKWSLLKVENNSSWVNLTHFREKTHLLALESIFVSSSYRFYAYIKFDTWNEKLQSYKKRSIFDKLGIPRLHLIHGFQTITIFKIIKEFQRQILVEFWYNSSLGGGNYVGLKGRLFTLFWCCELPHFLHFLSYFVVLITSWDFILNMIW